MNEMQKLAGVVIVALDGKGLSNTWIRKVVDLIANHGYKTVEEAKARATELQEWEMRVHSSHKQN